MALDVWFKDDVRRLIKSMVLHLAEMRNQMRGLYAQGYTDGYEAALKQFGVAFGMDEPDAAERGIRQLRE